MTYICNHMYIYPYKYYARIKCIYELQVVPRRAGGGSFKRETNINQRKTLPIESGQGDRPANCPNRFFCCERAFCRSMVVMCRGGDVTCFDVMRLVAG